MKNEKNKKTSSASRFFKDARKAPSSSTAQILLSPEEMEAANVRSMRSRGRLAHSLRSIARRRQEVGASIAPKNGADTQPAIAAFRLRTLSRDWLRVCRMKGFSPRTLTDRELCLERFFWFIAREKFETVGKREIEAYLLHIRTGHTEADGRFGTGATNPKAFTQVRPATYRHHFNIIAAFFSFQTKEKLWEKTPFEGIERGAKDDSADVIKPLSEAEIEALLATAKRGMSPTRDVAIIRFLFDTGVRASELCGIRLGDVGEKDYSVKILGKGDKFRVVYFGEKTARSLWKHMADMVAIWGDDGRKSTAPLFASERGSRAGQNIQPRALLALVQRIGERGGVPNVHPHRFRHTFAVNFLKNGGNQISLMRLLGHTDLEMTKHYVQFVEADLEEQHRKFSPGDRLQG